jgi:hypothetical protein
MLISIILAIVFSLFSTAVMLYVSMATPIGPWIETTLALVGLLIIRFASIKWAPSKYVHSIAGATAAGGIAGIVATGVGFSYPALYFLDASYFNSIFLNAPTGLDSLYAVGLLVAVGGLFGFIAAALFSSELLKNQNLPFSIGAMVAQTLTAFDRLKDAYQLMVGSLTATVYIMINRFFAIDPSIIIARRPLSHGIALPHFIFNVYLMPLYVAIGFVSGSLIAIPFGTGIIIKLFFLDGIRENFFWHLTPDNFLFAFLSGLVVYGAIHSLLDIPYRFYKNFKKSGQHNFSLIVRSFLFDKYLAIMLIISTAIALLFWLLHGASLFAALFIVLGALICCYQLLIIAGKIGLAPLGRFATFIMIPAVFLFGVTAKQAIIISTFIEVAGGAAVDVLFGQRMADEVGLSRKKLWLYQFVGLIVAALSIGFFLTFLHTKFGIGSAELLVQRARGRVLLLNVTHFDMYATMFGMLIAGILSHFSINSLLVLGGIVMSLDGSLMLLAGALLSYLFKKPDNYYPWWSGVFATASLWMVLSAFI